MGLHDFFEYDDRKAWINLKNHRVSFEEAMIMPTRSNATTGNSDGMVWKR
jgi:uncharacterized DUF497 family protein